MGGQRRHTAQEACDALAFLAELAHASFCCAPVRAAMDAPLFDVPLDAPLHAPELPRDVLVTRILAPLAGDAVALCTATCVAAAWRDAAHDPALWRSLHFLGVERRIARRVTDARLASLVARACGGLRCADLAGCTSLTARGVLAALQGLQLDCLAVRGIKAERDDGDDDELHTLLSSLVRHPRNLDVWRVVDRHAVCSATVDSVSGGLCSRLCDSSDELCEECGIFHCDACTAVLASMRAPPCAHVCDGCLGRNAGAALVECDGGCRTADGSASNGFCYACIRSCRACDACFCGRCSLEGGKLLACGNGACRNGDLFCEHCSFERDQLRVCHSCAEPRCFCRDCVDAGKLSRCDDCGNTFCAACSCESLTPVGDSDTDDEAALLLCAACAAAIAGDKAVDETAAW